MCVVIYIPLTATKTFTKVGDDVCCMTNPLGVIYWEILIAYPTNRGKNNSTAQHASQNPKADSMMFMVVILFLCRSMDILMII
jgi:hypothetical protein